MKRFVPTKTGVWFLRLGPVLVPASRKGFLFWVTMIIAGLSLGRGAALSTDLLATRLYVFAFVGTLIAFFVVGYAKSERW